MTALTFAVISAAACEEIPAPIADEFGINEEIALFKTVVERGAAYFYEIAKGGETQSA